MISITRATEKDYKIIVSIGNIAVEETHRDSSPAADMKAYMQKNYNNEAIKEELKNNENVYHIISYNGTPAGFSKIVLNEAHPNIAQQNTTKLDRIYLLKEYFGLKLGMQLLNANIECCKANRQSGIWLFTWVENKRAINFYTKAGFTIVGSHQFKVTETYSNDNYQMFLDLDNFRKSK
jgi:ribosomal protein S18 acetylase RimI-like enzyme